MKDAENTGELGEDDRGEIETLQSLSHLAFIDFFEKHGHYQKCHLCGGEEWTTLGHEGVPSAVTLEVFDGGGTFGLAYALTCDNCGHMRFINAKSVLASLKADGKE